MRGAPPHLWYTLLTYARDCSQKLFLYDVQSKSVSSSPSDVPWVCKWVLMNFSPKYRIASNHRPDVSKLAKELTVNRNKLRWRVYLDSQSPSLRLSKRHGDTPHCSHLLDPDTENWFHALRAKAIRAASSLAKTSRWKSNRFPLLACGLKKLKQINYYVFVNDKQPGYTFVRKSDIQLVERSALSAPLYSPIVLEHLPFSSITRQYKQIASRIARHHSDPTIFRQIVSSANSGLALSLLGLTCKTHKHAGAVSFRCIHRGLSPCFEGLSRWVVSIITPLLKREWILRDSRHFADTVKLVRVSEGFKQAGFDLKDFYLSGDPNPVAKIVASNFSEPLRSLLHDGIYFLLDNQYVISLSCGSAYKCMKGSGIGLLHSGHLSSVLFATSVEIPFFNQCGRLDAIGIHYYGRYHDATLPGLAARLAP